MLKKIKAMKKISQKTSQLGKEGLKEIGKIRESKSLDGAKAHINDAIDKVFEKVKKDSNIAMYNDDHFIKAADLTYLTIPPPVKIVLRKKRFRKIVLRVRDKCMNNDALPPDQCALEVVDEAFK